ncbi:MAG: sigma 54-interacting transcriptional regulator [Planctomycetes bacterium]|nr:sigma 54-interacting transcriptional regulator [Planctomycetota bacterium]
MSSKPTIAGVFPANGPATGGQVVTIAGTGFAGVSAVKFGGDDAVSFTLVSPIQIMATVPAHAAGEVSVTVAAAGGLATRENVFRYDPPAADEDRDPTPAEAQKILEDLVKSIQPDHVDQIPAMDGVIPGLPDPQDILTGELYRTLLEQIPAITFMTSFEEGLQKIYVSPQIESVLGYTKDEWLASPSLWYDRLHPEDRDRWTQEFSDTVLSRGTAVRSVYRFLHREGRVVWILGDVRIKRDEATGFPLFVQAVGFDITDLKRAQEALQEIASTIRETFWVLSPELDRIEYTSPAFQVIWGCSAESFKSGPVSEGILDLVHPADRELVARAFQKMKREETEIEHRVIGAGGRERWVRSRSVPVKSQGAGVARVIVVSEDVTERKQLQLQLDELSEKEKIQLRAEVQKESTFDSLLGSSQAMQDVRELTRKFSSRGSTVLIRGESGTGKELVARALHYSGARAKKPFKEVNSAGGVPEHLVYSELFGHEKGAFTGADRRRIGRFEEAHGGTLFLDEIGDTPKSTQVMLLKVLEDGCFTRLGGNEMVNVDVRVICATNRNLEEAIEKGGFREDLFYRINQIGIQVPPLRERSSDVAELAEHFLARVNRAEKLQVTLSEEALRLLKAHAWPGNVRELRHAIEQAVLVCDGERIQPKNLPPAVRLQVASAAGEDTRDKEKRLVEIVDDFERGLILDALERSDWVKTAAAKLLGINVKLLDYRIEKYGLARA